MLYLKGKYMNSRQKILLSLLECFGGKLQGTDMQKYLFIFCKEQDIPSYHFLPYKYGCFSFHAYYDKRKLVDEGILEDSETWSLKKGKAGILASMPITFQRYLDSFIRKTGCMKGDQLIKYVYLNYPYYAINSEITQDILSTEELSLIEKERPQKSNRALYSLGYEGKSLEEYLNILIKRDIKAICDVRKNAISRKYGFSKNTLKNAEESIGIDYRHFPELGIKSEKRTGLKTQNDYDDIFEDYK